MQDNSQNQRLSKAAEAALQLLDTQFVRIAREVRARWGSGAFDTYMDALLIDSRGGRAGFSSDVAQALLTLSREHNERFPDDSTKNPWFWSDPTGQKR